MRGVYTANVVCTSQSTAITLLYLQCPATCAVELLSASVTNRSNETNEQMDVGIYHVTTIGSPATSTSVTAQKTEIGDASSVMVAGTNLMGKLTTEPTTYSSDPVDRTGNPSLGGYRFEPIPEERPVVGPSKAIGIRLMTALSAAADLVVQLKWREFV